MMILPTTKPAAILSTYFPICKSGTQRRKINSFTPLGCRLMVISPRSSSKSCKQGALGYSFRLLLGDLAFDLSRVKQNKNKGFYPTKITAVSTTQHQPTVHQQIRTCLRIPVVTRCNLSHRFPWCLKELQTHCDHQHLFFQPSMLNR